MLSRKLPPGAAQAVDLARDPGPAQPSNRPVAYSREHLQLLPQTELVNLVLMWQSFHRMLPAPPHAVLQARAGPRGGQQPAQARARDIEKLQRFIRTLTIKSIKISYRIK